jgi:hypothetical protein
LRPRGTRGTGNRRIASDFSLPAGTVRGWLRRAAARVEAICVCATQFAVECDPLLGELRPTASPLADALQAVGAAIAAAIRRLGPIAPPWSLAATITSGLLTPSPGQLIADCGRAGFCALAGDIMTTTATTQPPNAINGRPHCRPNSTDYGATFNAANVVMLSVGQQLAIGHRPAPPSCSSLPAAPHSRKENSSRDPDNHPKGAA